MKPKQALFASAVMMGCVWNVWTKHWITSTPYADENGTVGAVLITGMIGLFTLVKCLGDMDTSVSAFTLQDAMLSSMLPNTAVHCGPAYNHPLPLPAPLSLVCGDCYSETSFFFDSFI